MLTCQLSTITEVKRDPIMKQIQMMCMWLIFLYFTTLKSFRDHSLSATEHISLGGLDSKTANATRIVFLLLCLFVRNSHWKLSNEIRVECSPLKGLAHAAQLFIKRISPSCMEVRVGHLRSRVSLALEGIHLFQGQCMGSGKSPGLYYLFAGIHLGAPEQSRPE